MPGSGAHTSYAPIVEGQGFFTTIAGLAISLAGFGSLIAWLRDDPRGWDAVNLWRLKTIVRHALSIAFICLALVPAHTITQDETATVRIGSAFIAALALSDIWRHRRRDPAVWDTPASWAVFMVASATLGLGLLGNLVWAGLGVVQVGALVMLSSPAGIFSNFVREIGRPRAKLDSEPG